MGFTGNAKACHVTLEASVYLRCDLVAFGGNQVFMLIIKISHQKNAFCIFGTYDKSPADLVVSCHRYPWYIAVSDDFISFIRYGNTAGPVALNGMMVIGTAGRGEVAAFIVFIWPPMAV